ncbi:MAG: hypothetical protein ABSC53_05225 [Bacteroidota bacterium]|jgi:hypothetical protein
MEIRLKAKSSSRPEPYSVLFIWNNKTLSVNCDCQAGELGQLCKHKLAFLQNDSSMLFDSKQSEELNNVYTWVKSTSFSDLLNELGQTERETEKAIANAKKQLSAAKHKLARLLKEGIK